MFHPGHQELHGVTVVVDTSNGAVYIGRFDKQDQQGIHLIGVSVFDPALSAGSRGDFLARTTQFGVRVDQPFFLLPSSQVTAIVPLSSVVSY